MLLTRVCCTRGGAARTARTRSPSRRTPRRPRPATGRGRERAASWFRVPQVTLTPPPGYDWSGENIGSSRTVWVTDIILGFILGMIDGTEWDESVMPAPAARVQSGDTNQEIITRLVNAPGIFSQNQWQDIMGCLNGYLHMSLWDNYLGSAFQTAILH